MSMQVVTTTQRVPHRTHAANGQWNILPACLCSNVVHKRRCEATGAFATRLHAVQPDAEGRAIGCSDLYNMTESINAQTAAGSALNPTADTSHGKSFSSAAQAQITQVQQAADQPSSTGTKHSTSTNSGKAAGYDSRYYVGLLTTDLQVNNKASGADMLKRSLQLAGGAAGVLGLLVFLFLKSNSLV